MLILALDTCYGFCSVTLQEDEKIICSLNEVQMHQQAERLVPMVEQALQESQKTYGEIDHIAVTIGPGSFTGIRIGLAAAYGLSIGAGIPIIGVSSLEVIAWKTIKKFFDKATFGGSLAALKIQDVGEKKGTNPSAGTQLLDGPEEAALDRTFVVALDAGNKQFYCQIFRSNQALGNTASSPYVAESTLTLIKREELEELTQKHLTVGSFTLLGRVNSDHQILADSEALAALVWHLLQIKPSVQHLGVPQIGGEPIKPIYMRSFF